MWKSFWRRAFLSIGAPFGEPGGGPVFRGFWELDERAVGDGASLYLQRLRGGGLGGRSFTVDPGRYAKKVSGYRHLSPSKGNLVFFGGGGSYTGDFDRWVKGAVVMRHFSAWDSMKGALGRAPLMGNPKDEVFERYAKCPVNGSLSLYRIPIGEPEGGSFAGTFERK